MELEKISVQGIRLSIYDGEEIARAYLYLLNNDLHLRKVGYMEDVFVNPGHRQEGFGSQIVQELVSIANVYGCYKVVCGVQDKGAMRLYENVGFEKNGSEMRYEI